MALQPGTDNFPIIVCPVVFYYLNLFLTFLRNNPRCRKKKKKECRIRIGISTAIHGINTWEHIQLQYNYQHTEIYSKVSPYLLRACLSPGGFGDRNTLAAAVRNGGPSIAIAEHIK